MRRVNKVLPSTRPHWVGDGFHVVPVFSTLAFTSAVSPFLMLDYAAPKHFEPTTSRRGVGKHPHRGFETVTIAFQGEVEHADSFGHRDVIGPGDVQWMTAASGLVHEEFISRNLLRQGGVVEMMQLWVNLPAKHKMATPRYQAIQKEQIPNAPFPGGRVRVIAGSHAGFSGPASTFTPMDLWEVQLDEKDTVYEFDLPASYNVMLFVRTGDVFVCNREEPVGKARLVMLGEGGRVRLRANEDNSSVVLLAGEPIPEAIAARGPFVMNTQEELMQAMADYQAGKFQKPA